MSTDIEKFTAIAAAYDQDALSVALVNDTLADDGAKRVRDGLLFHILGEAAAAESSLNGLDDDNVGIAFQKITHGDPSISEQVSTGLDRLMGFGHEHGEDLTHEASSNLIAIAACLFVHQRDAESVLLIAEQGARMAHMATKNSGHSLIKLAAALIAMEVAGI